MTVEEFILERLQEQYCFPKESDLTKLNYIEEGYIDSMGLIQFISELEGNFNIEFSDEEIISEDFQIVSKLINMVKGKIS